MMFGPLREPKTNRILGLKFKFNKVIFELFSDSAPLINNWIDVLRKKLYMFTFDDDYQHLKFLV